MPASGAAIGAAIVGLVFEISAEACVTIILGVVVADDIASSEVARSRGVTAAEEGHVLGA